MEIPPLGLASRPEKIVHMREATVDETLQYAEADPAREELVTTMFLNSVQKPEHYEDSALWTGDDRRLMLLWYWVHTNLEDVTITPTYNCDCGKTHTAQISMLDFTKTYRPIKGKAERNFDFKNRKITVRPLNGRAMEELELHLARLRNMDTNSGEYRAALRNVTVMESILLFSFGDVPLKDKTDPAKERQEKEKFVRTMVFSEYAKFRDRLSELLDDMNHGIETVIDTGRIYLLTDWVQCPERKDVRTRLRLPFRSVNHIPGL